MIDNMFIVTMKRDDMINTDRDYAILFEEFSKLKRVRLLRSIQNVENDEMLLESINEFVSNCNKEEDLIVISTSICDPINIKTQKTRFNAILFMDARIKNLKSVCALGFGVWLFRPNLNINNVMIFDTPLWQELYEILKEKEYTVGKVVI